MRIVEVVGQVAVIAFPAETGALNPLMLRFIFLLVVLLAAPATFFDRLAAEVLNCFVIAGGELSQHLVLFFQSLDHVFVILEAVVSYQLSLRQDCFTVLIVAWARRLTPVLVKVQVLSFHFLQAVLAARSEH